MHQILSCIWNSTENHLKYQTIMSTRREFLKSCSALAAMAAVTPASMFAALPRCGEVSLDSISATALAEQVNTSFAVADRGAAVTTLRLTAVQTYPARCTSSVASEEVSRECFSLLFTGDADRILGQDTYWFEHPGIGRFAMFIVPVGATDGSASVYEGVFDRPRERVEALVQSQVTEATNRKAHHHG